MSHAQKAHWMISKHKKLPLLIAAALASLQAHHDVAAMAPEAPVPARVVVSGTATPDPLDREASTASRLGLAVADTPASVNAIDARDMQARGLYSAEQAVDTMPGVSSGGAPGSPSQFSMRGFAGNQVTILRDGLYLGPADMTYRSQNTFNLASIEVLKGPGSVLYGQGAIAGTVNVITKKPVLDANAFDAAASYGRFDTSQAGVGGNVVLGQGLALRADLSRTGSHGFIERDRSDSLNGTLALLWQPRPDVEVLLSLDYLKDRPSRYYGTPLVAANFARQPLPDVIEAPGGLTLDRRMRSLNFNVGDARIASSQTLPRARIQWQVADGIVVSNDSYAFRADRQWINAESYVFNAESERVERDRFFVFHKQRLQGSQVSARVTRPVAGLRNRFAIGLDVSKLDFLRTRGFPDGDSVDALDPAPGAFGALAERRSPTRWRNQALFVEDALGLTDALTLVGGARIERFHLVRENYGVDGSFQAATSFERRFRPRNARLGLLYEGPGGLSPYVQVSTGQDPVGANILLVNAGQNFDLSRSRQIEAGVKQPLGRHGAFTLAWYDIERRDLLTQTSSDVVDTAGMQTSHGLEMTLDLRPHPRWRIDANLARTSAAYRDFIDTSNGIDASGNRPANIPRWTANLWTSYQFDGLPLEVGAGVRHVGQRFGNTANTVSLKRYTLLNLFGSYRLSRHVSLNARINNATDKLYAQWADVNYPSQIQLGAPLGYELGLVARF